ncbi:MAG: hypothetical protein JWO25_1915 [Alphaproteobacteria bacterium]|nr:hypothetical protein [Alphaproteobacteria bacterium]
MAGLSGRPRTERFGDSYCGFDMTGAGKLGLILFARLDIGFDPTGSIGKLERIHRIAVGRIHSFRVHS